MPLLSPKVDILLLGAYYITREACPLHYEQCASYDTEQVVTRQSL